MYSLGYLAPIIKVFQFVLPFRLDLSLNIRILMLRSQSAVLGDRYDTVGGRAHSPGERRTARIEQPYRIHGLVIRHMGVTEKSYIAAVRLSRSVKISGKLGARKSVPVADIELMSPERQP